MRTNPWLPWVCSLLLSGCGFFNGVHLESIATASGKPSNVAALVSVTKKSAPVRELDVSAFTVLEDGQPIDARKTDLRLLDPSVVAAFQTVLVLDLNHGSTDDSKRQLARAAAGFVRKVRQRQPVTVFVYDGSPRVRLVGEFSVESTGSGPEQLDNLLAMVQTDPSRNLRGAVIAGLDSLDSRLAKSTRPVQVGTLVVFSRGPDVAGRVKAEEFDRRVNEAPYQLVYIDVTGDATDSSTAKLSEKNHVASQGADTLAIAFEEAGSVAAHLTEQYYLLSYCSPARAGVKQLTVQVTVPGVNNEPETDSFEASFDATGFSPGCTSGNPPRFVAPKRNDGTAIVPSKVDGPTSPAKAEGDEPTSTTEADDAEVPPPNKPGYAP